jgi:hypothetical protein
VDLDTVFRERERYDGVPSSSGSMVSHPLSNMDSNAGNDDLLLGISWS